MSLTRFTVTAVRNLHPVTLSPSPRINILSGDNGSGKTSLLEAIHLLGLARSFRSIRLLPVIQYEQPACTIFGQVQLADGDVIFVPPRQHSAKVSGLASNAKRFEFTATAKSLRSRRAPERPLT